MNLLMMAPLLDSRGNLRYFIGAQIDVSGLVKDGTDLDAFQRMLAQQDGHQEQDEPKDEFRELSEMLNHVELDTVRKFGGNMHREQVPDGEETSKPLKARLLIQDQSTYDVAAAEQPPPKPDGRLSGPYKSVSRRDVQSELMHADNMPVPHHPASPIPPHPLHLAFAPRPRNSPVSISRPYRW